MDRSLSPLGARERLIFALDVADLEEARGLASSLAGAVGMLKVGLELYCAHGPEVASLARSNGLELFLDLKLHDIPETVARAVERVAGLGARYLTVHASGGRAMLREAERRAQAARSSGALLELVAVTVLTSLDGDDLASLGVDRVPAEHAVALAELAWGEGVRAFVCSAAEVALLRSKLGPEATLLTPGIRPAGATVGDQKRVSTPESAIRAGADRLVVGRPIRDALDRAAAARAIVASIEDALEGGRR
ncbi:MAG: orotidine-5'-phosphate decarboxylase [Deltaproteobacteria bacterium]|nr:orotidine-5'-phosphate decarboxylase [Deltaproteobacteria bacterium]